MMRITTSQFRQMEASAATEWQEETARELEALYPRHMQALGVTPQAVEAFVQVCRDCGRNYGIHSKQNVFKLAVLGLSIGAHFPHDPRFGDVADRTLARKVMPEDRRLTLFADHVSEWLASAWQGAGLDALGRQLLVSLRTHSDVNNLVRDLTFRFPAVAAPDAARALADICRRQADGYGLRTPYQRTAYAGVAFLQGVYWFDDPMMPLLRRSVEDAVSANALWEDIALFYGGFA